MEIDRLLSQTPSIAKRQIAERHLTEAFSIVIDTMKNSKSERLKYDAAKFVVESVLGKPKESIDDDREKSGEELALTLAQALKLAIVQNTVEPIEVSIDAPFKELDADPTTE